MTSFYKKILPAIALAILLLVPIYEASTVISGLSIPQDRHVTSVKVFAPAGDAKGADPVSQGGIGTSAAEEPQAKGADISGSYYRGLLSSKEKQIYDQLYNGFLANTRSIDIDDCDPDTAERCYKYVLYDCPEIFWVDTSYQYMITPDHQTVVSIQPDLIYKPQEIEPARQKMEAGAQAIADAVPQDARSDYEKAAFVFSALADELSYDEKMADNQDLATVFAVKITACGGYSKAYQYVCRLVGIDTVYLVGNADVGDEQILHAWNMQDLDGNICYADSTWGDKEERLPVDLAWLGLTYDSISKSHQLLDDSVAVKNGDARYEAWTLAGSYFDAFDEQTVLAKMMESIERGDGSVVMRFATPEVLETALDAVRGNASLATRIYERFPDKFPVAFTEGVYKSYKIGDLCALKVIWRYE